MFGTDSASSKSVQFAPLGITDTFSGVAVKQKEINSIKSHHSFKIKFN